MNGENKVLPASDARPSYDDLWRLVQQCERCDCPIMRTDLTDDHLVALRDALRFVVAGGTAFSGAELLNRMIEDFAATRLLLAEIVRDHAGALPASVCQRARNLAARLPPEGKG